MKPLHEKCKQKHHYPPDYPGNLEYIARRIGKRLVERIPQVEGEVRKMSMSLMAKAMSIKVGNPLRKKVTSCFYGHICFPRNR